MLHAKHNICFIITGPLLDWIAYVEDQRDNLTKGICPTQANV